jgi:ribonuclease-3
VFLDAGYDAARKTVLATFGPLIERLDPERPAKDAKTRLQEILQAKHRRLPQYRVVSVAGEAHKQSFEVECFVTELNLKATGTGTSRQRAEQQAAKAMLERLEGP